jgi:hypothetical protein
MAPNYGPPPRLELPAYTMSRLKLQIRLHNTPNVQRNVFTPYTGMSKEQDRIRKKFEAFIIDVLRVSTEET